MTRQEQRRIYDETNRQAKTQRKTWQSRSEAHGKAGRRQRNTQTKNPRRRNPNQMRSRPARTIKSRTPWLIGIRLRGDLRSDVWNYMNDVQHGFDRRRRFPHITLFGPFSTRMRRQQLISTIITMSKKYPEARFSTGGGFHLLTKVDGSNGSSRAVASYLPK